MKRIYTSPNLMHCDLVRAVLEESGVDVILKNELVSNTAGASIVGTLGFAWPEVWVKDEDVEEALECLRDSNLSFLEQK